MNKFFAILQGDRDLFSVLLQRDDLGDAELRPIGERMENGNSEIIYLICLSTEG